MIFLLGIPYHLKIYTGDKRNAGTNAQIYVVMHNNELSSSKIFLSGGEFERKSIDSITIDGPENLSPLTALDIGHDNSGTAPGWYLDKVCYARKREKKNIEIFYFSENIVTISRR